MFFGVWNSSIGLESFHWSPANIRPGRMRCAVMRSPRYWVKDLLGGQSIAHAKCLSQACICSFPCFQAAALKSPSQSVVLESPRYLHFIRHRRVESFWWLLCLSVSEKYLPCDFSSNHWSAIGSSRPWNCSNCNYRKLIGCQLQSKPYHMPLKVN